MAKRKKRLSWRAKRKGKTCKFGFRKHSAKCLKRPRGRRPARRSRRSSVRRQEASMWRKYKR